MRSVALVLDTNFEGDLAALAQSMPVWIISSPHNDKCVDRVWSALGDDAGVTSLFVIPGERPAVTFERALYDIDEHHGECSSSLPYEQIVVIGANTAVLSREVLEELGLERSKPAGSSLLLVRRRAKEKVANTAAGG
ncbi:MAG: hypothetical protein ACXWC4_14610 [Telluria sp.]